MKITDFLLELDVQISSYLNDIGFEKQEDGLYVRLNQSHDINVIFIQQHSSKLEVSLNFGVHYDFLPKAGSKELPTLGCIELSDCEFKYRVTPDIETSDHWWCINAKGVHEITKLIKTRLVKYFSYFDINENIGYLTLKDINDKFPDLFEGMTKIRACVVLASINEVKGNNKAATEFATYGLENAGMAVGPKKYLKQLLKRVESLK